MNVSSRLLDEVREAMGIKSDYAIAKLLGVERTTVSSYRSGRILMSEHNALTLARMINKPAAPIFVELAAERAKSPELAQVWKEAAKLLARSGRSARGK